VVLTFWTTPIFLLFLSILPTGEELSTLGLDDGRKTYKKTEIKLSVKVIYSVTKEGEGRVRGVCSPQNWHPFPLEKQKIVCFLSSLTWVYMLYKHFCNTTKLTCLQNQANINWKIFEIFQTPLFSAFQVFLLP